MMKISRYCVTGLGAYFYPFITVNNTNSQLKEPPPPRKGHFVRDIVLKKKLSSFQTLVTDDGLIAVISDDLEESMKFLNLVFATSLINSITPAKHITKSDIIQIVWDKKTDQILIYGIKPTERNYLAQDRDEPKRLHRITHVFPRRWIKNEKLGNVLIKANKYWKDSSLVEDLTLLVEGWGHIYELSPIAGFLYSWVFIENFISKYWDEYIKNLSRNSKERNALRSSNSWTVYNKIEVLSQVKKIGHESRLVLNELRDKRNKFVHERRKITQDDAVKCFSVAAYIILNQFGRKNPFSNLERVNRIRP